jgi:hypothetical protein
MLDADAGDGWWDAAGEPDAREELELRVGRRKADVVLASRP